MSNTKQWSDPDGQISNTGTSVIGVYPVDPTTLKAYAISGGGGGGGAVTIADGADVAQGSTTDAANANTVVGQLKQTAANLASIIAALDDGQETMANSLSVAIASDQSTIPVSAASLPLPTGAATDANLVNILADTADIETNTANIPPLGQTTMAASTPVAIANNQSTINTLDTNSAASKADLDTIATNTGNIPPKGQASMANSTPVVIANNQSNVSVTVATALPAGSNIIGLVEQSDGTNVSNVLKSDMTAAGQNAELIAPAYFSSGTLTLNAGSPNTVWYDLGNYPWISMEILTNSSAATLTFQTSGDSAQTNIRSTQLADTQSTSGSASTTTTSAVASYVGPRTGRYFRVSSNVSGGNTVTLVLTFYTAASSPLLMGTTFSALTGVGSATPGTAVLIGYSDGTNLQALRTPTIFQTATATASGNTAVWSPSGKKFRLMSYSIEVTANAAQTVAGLIEITLQDATTALNMGVSVFVPSVAATVFGNNVSTGWRILGNGKLSAAASNALNVNLSASLTSGEVRVNAIGTEE